MDWSPQQSHALVEVEKWRTDKSEDCPQIFHLFGYAGTGKTTLAKHIASACRRPMFAAYTGKAALILRKKGCGDARTIHGLIYRPVGEEITDEPEFELNEDSDLRHADLLLIDEVSMVDKTIGEDLLSFGKKILVMGDPGQLPPINGSGFFNPAKPEIMLTEIRRQALDNPLIKMSLDIRTGKGVPKGNYGDSRVIAKPALTPADCTAADQLICGTNEYREKFNGRLRLQQGFQSKLPEVGEKLICLRNNRELGLFNGGMWRVLKSTAESNVVKLNLESLDIENLKVTVTVPFEFFEGGDAVKKLAPKFRFAHQEFTYGYAITCHKSQGSQWDRVLIWNENTKFRENARQWLYTAVTRAAERITLCV